MKIYSAVLIEQAVYVGIGVLVCAAIGNAGLAAMGTAVAVSTVTLTWLACNSMANVVKSAAKAAPELVDDLSTEAKELSKMAKMIWKRFSF